MRRAILVRTAIVLAMPLHTVWRGELGPLIGMLFLLPMIIALHHIYLMATFWSKGLSPALEFVTFILSLCNAIGTFATYGIHWTLFGYDPGAPERMWNLVVPGTILSLLLNLAVAYYLLSERSKWLT